MKPDETNAPAAPGHALPATIDGPKDPCSGPSGEPACEDSRLRHDSRFPDSVSADLGDSIAEDRLSPAGDEPPVY